MARKKKKMDHLTRDVLAAEKAGMSYGKWKAKHPHTLAEDDEPAPPPDHGKRVRTCMLCGKEFVTSATRTNRLYCSEECRIEQNHIRDKTRRENQPGEIVVCRICGTSFQAGKRTVYCGRKCAAIGDRQSNRESMVRFRAKKKEAANNGTDGK